MPRALIAAGVWTQKRRAPISRDARDTRTTQRPARGCDRVIAGAAAEPTRCCGIKCRRHRRQRVLWFAIRRPEAPEQHVAMRRAGRVEIVIGMRGESSRKCVFASDTRLWPHNHAQGCVVQKIAGISEILAEYTRVDNAMIFRRDSNMLTASACAYSENGLALHR